MPFLMLRRARGVLLRAAQARRSGVLIGSLLVVASVVLATGDFGWESWVSDGLGLVVGGSGTAFMIATLSGRQPDWIDSADDDVE